MDSSASLTTLTFTKGIKAGIPLAVGYLPIAVTFGFLARGAGMTVLETSIMSLIVFAGASQFVGVNLISLGATTMEIVLTTFILNFRHFILTSALSRRMKPGLPAAVKAAIAFGITDESFTVAALQEEKEIPPAFLFGLNGIGYVAWNGGTLIGVIAATGLPDSIQKSMGIALYAMFVGLLIPTIRRNRIALIISIVAMGVNWIFKWIPALKSLNGGWGIVISTVIAATLGAILFPRESEVTDDE